MKEGKGRVVDPVKAGGTRRNQDKVQAAMAEPKEGEDELFSKTTKLDRDIAEAKRKVEEKKRNKNGAGSSPQASKPAPSAEEAPKSQRKPRLTDEQREARDAKVQEERAQRRELRAKERAERREAKQAARQTPHLSKVRKAQEQLPELTERARTLLDTLTKDLIPGEVNALGQHLQHHYRHHVTEAASKRELRLQQKVRLLGGGAKYVGKVGVVTRLQRIRCYVKVEGIGTPAYVFTSETEDVAD